MCYVNNYALEDNSEVFEAVLGRRSTSNVGTSPFYLPPGKILSPFLVHGTFTVRLHMVNYSGYG